MPLSALHDLTDLHVAILSALWRLEEATIAELHAALGPGTDATPKTVATLLSRLEKRKLVASRKEGREGVYRATVKRRDVLLARLQGLLGAAFHGTPTLGSAAVRRGDTRQGDAARLRALLRKAERDLDD